MKKTGFAIALAAMLVVPASALGVTQADKKAAKAQCKEMRATAPTYEDFKALGTPAYKNLGDCITRVTREEARERRAARRAAKEECRTQGLKGRAYGQCVKAAAQENKQEADAQDKVKLNAAKDCAEEKAEDRTTYDAEHGTGKNAFGKCVSAHAKAKRTGSDPHADAA